MPEDREVAIWVDGAKLYAWLRRRFPRLGEPSNRYNGGPAMPVAVTDDDMRQVRRWRRGSMARVAVVERVIVRAGHLLNDLPDEVFVRDYGYGFRAGIAGRREAVARYRAGETAPQLAPEYGVRPNTIYTWVNRYG